ncbi:MAG: Phosphomannomutase, partial [Desulfonauticus sp. 38_4375]
SLIKAKMKEERALLAGEMSGHMFFADRYFGFDDAIYAAYRLVKIVSQNPEKKLSSYLGDWPKTITTPEIRLDCPEEKKFKVVQKALTYFKDQYEVIDVDGVRIVFPDGWGLLRASNTQPVLVLRFEAESEKRLEEIRSLIENPLKQWIEEA